MELLVIFVIIFIIYGAGWIWQTVNDIVRDAHRVSWSPGSAGQGRMARVLLGGHDLAELAGAYQRFADLRQGEVYRRQIYESPKVSFLHHGSRVLLSVYEANEGGGALHTQLSFTVPEGWGYRLEVLPRDPSREAPAGGDLTVGDPEFDARYLVKSNDPRFARDFLDGAARQAIDELRSLLGKDRILVSMNSSRLMVRKEAVITTPDDLTVFADLAGRLLDRVNLFWQRASGIEILEDGPAAPESGPPMCQICGSEISPEGRVSCRRCGTPHHKDCWEFNGQCSTYACGEKRFATKR